MWYKYVDRTGYDAVRIWRYLQSDLGVPTSSSTRTITEFSRINIPDSSVNIYTEPSAARDQYLPPYTAQRIHRTHFHFRCQRLLLVRRRTEKN